MRDTEKKRERKEKLKDEENERDEIEENRHFAGLGHPDSRPRGAKPPLEKPQATQAGPSRLCLQQFPYSESFKVLEVQGTD
mmetsp:Transcript_19854/g.38912  ORF Transcript_19854/g.38912 Transcript_19854/m.38912 type:complete len:81 (+) Transcript_19854:1748-1990(+)